MATLYVVTVGLYGAVDAGSTGILLLRKARGQTIGRDPIPDHVASVMFRADGAPRETLLEGQDVTFLFDGQGAFSVQDERGRFLSLPRLLQAANLIASVNPECLGNTGRCASLLAGRIILPGGIFHPVEIAVRGGESFFISSDFSLEVLARHSVLSGVRMLDFVKTSVANGSLWIANSSRGGFKLRIGGIETELEKASRQDLSDIGANPDESDSYVVWILNTPRGRHHNGHGEGNINTEREIRPDRHFFLLYDFLRSERELERWVPVVRSPRSLTETPPGSQCIPPLLS